MVITVTLTGCRNLEVKESSKNNVENLGNSPRIVATSMSVVEIMDKLNVDLVGVPESKVDKLPKRYKGTKKVGSAMSPDMEKLKALNPDLVLSPVSLLPDLLPKYRNQEIEYGFLNLNNIEGMYKSIDDLGILLHREKEARKLRQDYESYMKNFREKHKEGKHPKVLILMGLPGSYVVATDKSYAGSLVEMAGGKNVYKSKDKQFVNVNVEDMLKREPDIILRTSHAMPEKVKEMFAEEFKTNDIWKNFKAVSSDRVYDLDNKHFGMSAKFNYPEALERLEEIFYGEAFEEE